ncbi:hypothetical protein [Micromonospora echinofusca]|uniref:hypothetical protein n=1 Tax=Micromonospora echinofusca TaxID=47858 RepID=UPI001FCBC9DB|nr:hypothetical protein [Micromonospora echinofusca]
MDNRRVRRERGFPQGCRPPGVATYRQFRRWIGEEVTDVDEVLRVETGELRAAARRLAETGYRLGHGLTGQPGLLVPAPGWQATGALAELDSVLHGWLCRLGGRVADGATGVGSAADGYDAVDSRAAGRLTGVPR